MTAIELGTSGFRINEYHIFYYYLNLRLFQQGELVASRVDQNLDVQPRERVHRVGARETGQFTDY